MTKPNKKGILISLLNQANQDTDIRESLCYEILTEAKCSDIVCTRCPFSSLNPPNVLIDKEA
jgi:hypothetical protein